MQTCTTWVREHVQHIKFFLVTVLSHLIGLLFHPSLLPLLLNFYEIIIRHSILRFNIQAAKVQKNYHLLFTIYYFFNFAY